MNTSNKRLIGIQLFLLSLLLVPAIAMQFGDDVKWSPFDFLVMALLLSGLGFLCEFVLRKAKSPGYRILFVGACVLGFLIVWVELAVGIFN